MPNAKTTKTPAGIFIAMEAFTWFSNPSKIDLVDAVIAHSEY